MVNLDKTCAGGNSHLLRSKHQESGDWKRSQDHVWQRIIGTPDGYKSRTVGRSKLVTRSNVNVKQRAYIPANAPYAEKTVIRMVLLIDKPSPVRATRQLRYIFTPTMPINDQCLGHFTAKREGNAHSMITTANMITEQKIPAELPLYTKVRI